MERGSELCSVKERTGGGLRSWKSHPFEGKKKKPFLKICWNCKMLMKKMLLEHFYQADLETGKKSV